MIILHWIIDIAGIIALFMLLLIPAITVFGLICTLFDEVMRRIF